MPTASVAPYVKFKIRIMILYFSHILFTQNISLLLSKCEVFTHNRVNCMQKRQFKSQTNQDK